MIKEFDRAVLEVGDAILVIGPDQSSNLNLIHILLHALPAVSFVLSATRMTDLKWLQRRCALPDDGAHRVAVLGGNFRDMFKILITHRHLRLTTILAVRDLPPPQIRVNHDIVMAFYSSEEEYQDSVYDCFFYGLPRDQYDAVFPACADRHSVLVADQRRNNVSVFSLNRAA